MLTQNQKGYLETVADDRVARVVSFDPAVQKVASKIISEIESSLPSLKVIYLGSSKLGIAGENDIDLNILAGDDFDSSIPVLTKSFGEPTEVDLSKRFVRWDFIRDGFPVEVYFTDVMTPSLQEQIDTQTILEKDKALLKEYERIKIQANGVSYKEYLKRKYEFWNAILGMN